MALSIIKQTVVHSPITQDIKYKVNNNNDNNNAL